MAIALTVAYPFIYNFLHQCYSNSVNSALEKYPEAIRPYIDYKLFWPNLYEVLSIVVALVVAGLWIMLVLKVASAKPKSLAVASIALLIIFIVPIPAQSQYFMIEKTAYEAQATPTPINTVDVLLVGDEEFWQDPSGVQNVNSNIDAANYFTSSVVTDSFNSTFGVEFRIVDAIHWNSPNEIDDAAVLLQLAIRANGGVYDIQNGWWAYPGKTYIKGGYLYKIRFLLVVAGQYINMLGLAPPMWNASILQYPASYFVIRHEFSHLYWLEYCTDIFCYMDGNPSGWRGFTILRHVHWCADCKQTFLNNRDQWKTAYTLQIMTCVGGTSSLLPGIYAYDRGDMVEVTAIPLENFSFKYWKIDIRTIYCSNPIAVVMDNNHTLQAFFSEDYIGGSSGGSLYYYVR